MSCLVPADAGFAEGGGGSGVLKVGDPVYLLE